MTITAYDPDGDGLYEDVNGDGAVNIVDVDALSRHLESTAAGANWSAYDYTGDNRPMSGYPVALRRHALDALQCTVAMYFVGCLRAKRCADRPQGSSADGDSLTTRQNNTLV